MREAAKGDISKQEHR